MPEATSYTLYWDDHSPVAPASAHAIAGVTSPYVHSQLLNGETYVYVVTASRGPVESDPSSEASATPSASANLYDPPWASALPVRTLNLDYDERGMMRESGIKVCTMQDIDEHGVGVLKAPE